MTTIQEVTLVALGESMQPETPQQEGNCTYCDWGHEDHDYQDLSDSNSRQF